MDQLPYSIYYESSRKERLRLDSAPFFAVGGSIFDSEWSFATSPRPNLEGGRLISRRRSTGEKQLILKAAADSPALLSRALERLSSVYEYDLNAMTPGRLWVCGMYLSCYIVSSEKTLSPDFPSMAEVRLSILPEIPAWCRERTYSTTSGTADGHIYPYSYPYRYGSGLGTLEVLNDSGAPCPMRIKLFGPCDEAYVLINGSAVGLDMSLGAHSHAVIDQQTREIYQITSSGGRVNRFDKRIRNGKSFEYLPAGQSAVEYGGCDAAITVISMRSEPPWSN